MRETAKSKHWRYIFYAVGVIGLSILLYSNRDVLVQTWELLQEVNIRILLLMPVVQILSYYFIANFYRRFLAAFNRHVGLRQTWGLVFAITFVNQILPSGGLSGISYLAYALRNVAPAGTVTLAQLTRYVFAYLSYGVVLLIAFLFLLVGHSVTPRTVVAGTLLLIFSLVVAMLFWMLINSKQHINGFVNWLTRLLNRVAAFIRRGRKPLIDAKKLKNMLTDFHEGVKKVKEHRGAFSGPLLFMILSTLAEVTIVNLAFLAVGQPVNPGLIMISFAAANAAGVISVIPGDVGVHELTMIFVLSSAGVDSAVAVSATLLYRVFNKMTILPIGFFFYTRYLKPLRKANG